MLLENSSFPEDSRVLLQARSLTEMGYRVLVVAPTEEDATRQYENIEGIHVYRYPHPPEWGGVLGYVFEYAYSILMQWLIALYIFGRHGFDTIHMHTPPDMNAVIPVFFRLFRIRFVYDLHDLSPELFQAQRSGRSGLSSRLIHWALLQFERFASRMSNMSISTNQSQRDIHVARCGVAPEKFHIVRNGPNEAFLSDTLQLRSELRQAGCITLGYVGVMGIQDGVDYLIQAIDILVNRRGRQEVRAVLVGSGKALPELKRQVHALGLAQYVLFTGRVPFAEVPAYVASFDICCTPDPSNPYNDSCTTIKTMEYMALGKPVVCFETTENMKTAGAAALYAGENDVFQYATLIEKLIDDPDLRSRMGQAGRQRVLTQLAWKHQARQLISAYDGLHRISREETTENKTSPKAILSNLQQPVQPNTLTPWPSARDQVDVQFAFHGDIAQVLNKHYQRDCEAARLSTKFRLYYRLRPWMPTWLRLWVQSSRNSSLTVPVDWYIPKDFLSDLNCLCQQQSTSTTAQSTADQMSQLVIHPWPDGHRYAVSLTHDIESSEGMKRVADLAELEEKLGLRSAWFFVPHNYPLDYGLIRDLKARGHEVGVHGYNHDGKLFFNRSMFESRAKHINWAGKRFEATGFRSPMVHRNLQWMQSLEFDYDASCFDIDPFQPMPGGVGGVWPFIAGKLVELPYTLPQDHTLMITLGQSACDVWIDKQQLIKRLAGLALLITHPDYLNSPKRLAEYQRFCEHVAESTDKWHALPSQIASWWRIRHASAVQSNGELLGPASERGRVVPLASLFEIN
jgi:glycosyltransferase involved in cell wall biosynthesis/peptidoglycan/xylan/chitin deacetylase (PgdA/CDA1 family)